MALLQVAGGAVTPFGLTMHARFRHPWVYLLCPAFRKWHHRQWDRGRRWVGDDGPKEES